MIAPDKHSPLIHVYDADYLYLWRNAASRLVLFRDVMAAETGQAMLALLDLLTSPSPGSTHTLVVAAAYGRLFSGLAATVGQGVQDDENGREVNITALPAGDRNAWRAYVVARVLRDDNPFTRAAQMIPASDIAPALLQAAAHDLHLLQEMANLDGDAFAGAVSQAINASTSLPSWTGLQPPAAPLKADLASSDQYGMAAMATRLAASTQWAGLISTLVDHVARHGSGPLAGHTALRWVHATNGAGRIAPVLAPDPISMDDLIGYDHQRRELAHNTERFLAGLPANDVLLFGARGTGKSSSVKALLTAYADQGLRMVEVPRDALGDLPAICAVLRGRAGRYILFVDDLSFEEQETSYKDLKAVLEGRLEARPPNVRVYATSNRRHLVREQFSDRARPGAVAEGEVRAGDTAQEKLSLADRFGLVLVYTTPDQERYLDIVAGLARRRGLHVPPDELRALALRWAEWHNGRSGRTARQFVDSIIGA